MKKISIPHLARWAEETSVIVDLPISPANVIQFIDDYRPNIGRMAQSTSGI